jgi:hypothetical protein
MEVTDVSQVLLSSTKSFSYLKIMGPASTSEMSINFNQAIQQPGYTASHPRRKKYICLDSHAAYERKAYPGSETRN